MNADDKTLSLHDLMRMHLEAITLQEMKAETAVQEAKDLLNEAESRLKTLSQRRYGLDSYLETLNQ